jgi:hypothetical protein
VDKGHGRLVSWERVVEKAFDAQMSHGSKGEGTRPIDVDERPYESHATIACCPFAILDCCAANCDRGYCPKPTPANDAFNKT